MNDQVIKQDELDAVASESFRSLGAMLRVLSADLRANRRDPKSQLVLIGFRVCQWLMHDPVRPRLRSLPFVLAYRIFTEFALGMELRPKTRIGSGLSIFHGYSLVVNDHAVIGRGVHLRNGVVVGHAAPGGQSPRIHDGVSIGANASVIGPINIGADARIGAGAVVVKDVPSGATAVGNPARIIP